MHSVVSLTAPAFAAANFSQPVHVPATCLFREALVVSDLGRAVEVAEEDLSLAEYASIYPDKISERNHFLGLDDEYSKMVYQHVKAMDKSSKGAVTKTAEKIYQDLLDKKLITKAKDGVDFNRIRNGIEKDVKWEMLKARKVQRMIDEKCRVVLGNGSGLDKLDPKYPNDQIYIDAVEAVCRHDVNFDMMYEAVMRDDFMKIYLYENSVHYAQDGFRGDMREAQTSMAITTYFHEFDAERNLVTKLFIGVDLPAVVRRSKEIGAPLTEELTKTLRHETNHAHFYFQNGLMSGFAANPFRSESSEDIALAREVRKCVAALKADDSVSARDLNLVLRRLDEQSTAEGLAELIGDVEPPSLRKLCGGLYGFSFRKNVDRRQCGDDKEVSSHPKPRSFDVVDQHHNEL